MFPRSNRNVHCFVVVWPPTRRYYILSCFHVCVCSAHVAIPNFKSDRFQISLTPRPTRRSKSSRFASTQSMTSKQTNRQTVSEGRRQSKLESNIEPKWLRSLIKTHAANSNPSTGATVPVAFSTRQAHAGAKMGGAKRAANGPHSQGSIRQQRSDFPL